jgi:regulatory protein
MPRRPRPPSPSSRAGAGPAIRETRHKHAGTGIERERGAAADIDPALIENWALSYLGRFASSAENLRRVLRRRARRRAGAEAARAADAPIDALIARYLAAGLLDDAAYAAARARARLSRGESLRRIAAGLAAKGVGTEERADALNALREDGADPDLAAACAFARRRRLGPFRRDPAIPADRDRALAAFARAGFARREAEAVLACADPEAVAALLAPE